MSSYFLDPMNKEELYLGDVGSMWMWECESYSLTDFNSHSDQIQPSYVFDCECVYKVIWSVPVKALPCFCIKNKTKIMFLRHFYTNILTML